MFDPEQFVKDRNEAFVELVMHDNIDAMKVYMDKYGIQMPKRKAILLGGVYKAVQEVTNIPQEVKDVARKKCEALGLRPTMF